MTIHTGYTRTVHEGGIESAVESGEGDRSIAEIF